MSQRQATVKRIVLCLIIFLIFHWIARSGYDTFAHTLAHLGFFLLALYISWQIAKFISATGIRVKSDDKAVLITGCDSGFGNVFAKQLANLGYQVFAGVLNTDREGARSLRKVGLSNLHIIKLDVKNIDDVRSAKEYVIKTLEPNRKLWAIVNNAGVGHYAGVDWGHDDLNEIYHDQFEVNTFGTLRVTRSFLPLLRANPGSRVVIMASMAGRFVFPGLTAYAMSKHAVRALGNGLRRETRPYGVNVSIIEPVMYATPITDLEICTKDLKSNWMKTPEGRRREIGEQEYSVLAKNVRSFLHMRRANIQEVIDALLSSVTSTEPRYFYRVSGLKEWFGLHILEILPEEIQDFFLDGATFSSLIKLIQNQA